MVITSLFLNASELKALKLMADEKSNFVIKRDCDIRDLPNFNVALKRKTGIRNLKDSQEVQEYLSKVERAAQTVPTDAQLGILRRMLGISHKLHTIESLSNNLEMTRPEAEQAYADALAAIGVFATEKSTRAVQARLWFASQPRWRQSPNDPVTPKQWEALELYAYGASFETVRKLMGYVKEEYAAKLIKSICFRLAITARGRGVQRRLAALAVAQEKAKYSGEDPLF